MCMGCACGAQDFNYDWRDATCVQKCFFSVGCGMTPAAAAVVAAAAAGNGTVGACVA
jgi:hypothetical protein